MSRSSPIQVSTVVGVLFFIPAAVLSQTGTISGVVRVEGTVPAPRLIEVDKNQEVCGDTIRATDVIVSEGNVAYAVAFIEGLDGETDVQEYLLSNFECSFDPPVLAATVGGVLVVDNQDDVLHNTHLNLQRGTRTRTVGNWALSRKGARIRTDRPLRRPGIIDVECDAHGWMHAKIMIFDHPYFAVTDTLGVFEITEVPVGTHTITVWHEVFGELHQSITVEADATTSVSFNFSADAVGAGETRFRGESHGPLDRVEEREEAPREK